MPFTLLPALFSVLSSDVVNVSVSNMSYKDITRTFILMERLLIIKDVNQINQILFHVDCSSYSLFDISFSHV